MKLNMPFRLSPIGYAIAAGILGTILFLAYQNLSEPEGSEAFPADVSDTSS